MKVLGCYSMKGGVGKTSTAVNLAWLAADAGHRTLLWDLDSQGAASFYYRITAKGGGARKMLAGERDPMKRVRGTDWERLDLLPADPSYRKLDIVLRDGKKPLQQLARLLQQLDEHYDLVVLDCPPGLGLATEAMLTAADVLVMPIVPNRLTVRTLDTVGDHLVKRRKKGRSVPVVRPFFSMVDRRKLIHLQQLASPPSRPFRFLRTSIPFSSLVERMELQRAPLVSFDAASPAARAYHALWQELGI